VSAGAPPVGRARARRSEKLKTVGGGSTRATSPQPGPSRGGRLPQRGWRTRSRLTSASRLPPPSAARRVSAAARCVTPARGTDPRRAAPTATQPPSHALHGAQLPPDWLEPSEPKAQRPFAHLQPRTEEHLLPTAEARRARASPGRRRSIPPTGAPLRQRCAQPGSPFEQIRLPATGKGRNAAGGGARRLLGRSCSPGATPKERGAVCRADVAVLVGRCASRDTARRHPWRIRQNCGLQCPAPLPRRKKGGTARAARQQGRVDGALRCSRGRWASGLACAASQRL
jgi:hypothetical protein